MSGKRMAQDELLASDLIEERGVPCGENRWRETRERTLSLTNLSTKRQYQFAPQCGLHIKTLRVLHSHNVSCVQSSASGYRPQAPAIQSDYTSRAGARGLGAAGRINPISRPLRRRWRRHDHDESVRRGSRGTF